MLRDVLCQLPGLATWPCDEINAVWKHGHLLATPYDDYAASMATPALARFVETRFARLAEATGCQVVVEKTCANSVRVGYVRALLPAARFIFVHRNGADAVASAIKRWTSSIDLKYTLRKLRYVPAVDLPVYGWRYLRNRAGQMLDDQQRMRAWGPMTARVAAAAQQGDIAAAAAWQWRECVERSLSELPAHCARVQYESFVRAPASALNDLTRQAGLDVACQDVIEAAVSTVRADLAGQGVEQLEALGARETVASIINPALAQLGYDTI